MTDTALFQRMSLSVMKRFVPGDLRWHYEHGLVLSSVYKAGIFLNKPDYTAWVKSMFDTKITEAGEIVSYRDGEYNLDQINMGKLLFAFYRETGQEKYHRAIETLRTQLKGQPRTKSGGFWHKKIYPYQMWLDGLYMAQPFYAEYAANFLEGDVLEGAVDDITRQFTLMASKVRDPRTGLLYHAWDESGGQGWADPETGCSPHFWGRALGWYCMAVLDTLDFIPPAFTVQREALVQIAKSLAEPLLAVQDRQSGLWYQVLDQGNREGNYLESSCSAMFCYFFFKLLAFAPDNADRIQEAAVHALQGLCGRLREDSDGLHLGGICAVAGLGGTPYRDGSFTYYVNEPRVEDDFKGVGPFILASLEQAKQKR